MIEGVEGLHISNLYRSSKNGEEEVEEEEMGVQEDHLYGFDIWEMSHKLSEVMNLWTSPIREMTIINDSRLKIRQKQHESDPGFSRRQITDPSSSSKQKKLNGGSNFTEARIDLCGEGKSLNFWRVQMTKICGYGTRERSKGWWSVRKSVSLKQNWYTNPHSSLTKQF